MHAAPRELRQIGDVAPEIVASLRYAERLDTLEDVLHRGIAVVEIIVQDEYTHDVVCRAGEVFVVFDTT